MKRIKILIMVLVALNLASCAPAPGNAEMCNEQVPMYPDYTDITIPANIAPLNFLLRGNFSRVCVYADGTRIASGRGGKLQFRPGVWKKFLASNEGRKLEMTVCARTEGKWKEFRHFSWELSSDRVDPYLTYRLIEPDYETFNLIVLQQRHIESFETDNFSDSRVIGNKRMNCHTYASQNPDTSMFYVRGENGGAFLNCGGNLRKLAIKGDGMVSGSVYFGFSPSARYICFSTNIIIPGYHATASQRMEIYDTKSDVYVADLENGKFISTPLTSKEDVLETFPCFSSDGKSMYWCAAALTDTLDYKGVEKLKYSLCRIGFDEETGCFGNVVDTVYNARLEGGSVCHPRVSPDGRYVCFSSAKFGTFPLWHKDSDLMLIDLTDGKRITMEAANSDKSDTYHSWSSNSRWLVFASKRDDGIYGKPYFTHIDTDGNCSKAFVLPQKHPDFYDNIMKSYNAPELGKGPLPFSTYEVERALGQEASQFHF